MRPDRPCQGSARVSASKREVTQHLPGRRPCNQPRTAAPPALPTAPLDWTTPSCTLPRTPTRKGGPTCGGSPLRPRPSSGQRRKHLGSQHNGAHRPPWTRRASRQAGYSPSAHGGTTRLNNRDLRRCPGPTTKHPRPSIDPRGNPARAFIECGAASAQAISAAQALGWPQDTRVHTRNPPDTSGSDKRSRTSGRPIRQGQPPSSIRHSRKPQPPTPQRIQRKDGPRRIVAKATRRAPTSNSGAAALPNAPPLPPTAPEQDAQPARRKAARTNGNDQAPRTGQPPPSKAYPGTTPAAAAIATALPGKAYQRQGMPPPLRSTPTPPTAGCVRRIKPRLLPECRELAQQRDAKPRAPCQGTHKGRGGDILSPPSISQESESDAQRSRLKTHRQPLSTPLDSDAVTASQAKTAARETSQAKDTKEKSEQTHLWERNAHVGLGQPRTRHHAQVRPLRTPLRHRPSRYKQPPRTGVKCGRTSGRSLEKGPSHPPP
ncbi:hypothetical protein WOLCODRAFT_148544 [Wolfiporia cocos MD-104 SS10]|uniref:Uncharacterized protein n=1 Tax=Wolfiporia cocos (strain MD-104) TaxID=742152 RepID=A0A2H3JCU1_WOLCO|nr:hypothetical protein WOLCODRAFT_148544 [Wolfiporia cocos MD-104 SS10]